jgi:hypothetical protein
MTNIEPSVVWEHAPHRRQPDAMVMTIPGLQSIEARIVARDAVEIARRVAPKLSGASSRRLLPYFGVGFIGIRWIESYVFFQEMGIRGFTMRRLAGKTIPMWIDDPTGRERARNPRARTRVTVSGKVQVLIFRRAAHIGQQKLKVGRFGTPRWVPASYPGAPGRIAIREMAQPLTTPGQTPGAIVRRNVGVRWRHPGLDARLFLHHGLTEAAFNHGLPPGQIFPVVMAEYVQAQRRRAS